MTITIQRPSTRIITPGARGIRYAQPGGGAAGPLIYDTFTDTDGTLLSAHAPDINTSGNPWETNTWEVRSASARLVDSSYYGTIALIDSGIANYRVTATLVLYNVSSVNIRGIAVRNDGSSSGVDNANNFKIGLIFTSGRFEIWEGNTVRATTPFGAVAGVPYVIVAECSGNTITATVNGGSLISYNAAASVGRMHVGMSVRYALDYLDEFTVEAL